MRKSVRKRAEPTLALINVVFLLLAFFILAGTIASPPPSGLVLVSLGDGTAAPIPPDTVAIAADGTAIWPPGIAGAEDLVARLPAEAGRIVRIMPDRGSAAAALVAMAARLRAAGARDVRLIAERAAAPAPDPTATGDAS